VKIVVFPKNKLLQTEITNSGRELGFDELENNDFRELLSSHSYF
jgi:hypothetical protein